MQVGRLKKLIKDLDDDVFIYIGLGEDSYMELGNGLDIIYAPDGYEELILYPDATDRAFLAREILEVRTHNYWIPEEGKNYYVYFTDLFKEMIKEFERKKFDDKEEAREFLKGLINAKR